MYLIKHAFSQRVALYMGKDLEKAEEKTLIGGIFYVGRD